MLNNVIRQTKHCLDEFYKYDGYDAKIEVRKDFIGDTRVSVVGHGQSINYIISQEYMTAHKLPAKSSELQKLLNERLLGKPRIFLKEFYNSPEV